MKTLIQISLLISLTFPFFSFTSPVKPESKNIQGPNITATVSTQLTCKAGNSCSNWTGSMQRRHGFKITLTGYSISFYNSNFTYKVYTGTTPYAASAVPIATFPCTQNVVEFASTQLLNNTTYSVIIETPSGGASGMVTFTTGTGAGTNCIQTGVKSKKRNATVIKNN